MKLYIICILREKNFKSKQNNMSLFTLFKILNLKNSQIWIVSNRYLSIKCIMYYFINIYCLLYFMGISYRTIFRMECGTKYFFFAWSTKFQSKFKLSLLRNSKSINHLFWLIFRFSRYILFILLELKYFLRTELSNVIWKKKNIKT